MLKVTHNIKVNQAGDTPLTADELWQGLLLKVHHPEKFNPEIKHCEIQQLNATTWARNLDFESHIVTDEVQLLEQHQMQFLTKQRDQIPQGVLKYQLLLDAEELVLSCDYQTDFPEASSAEDQQVYAILKQAYLQLDQEMVQTIRQFKPLSNTAS